MNKHDLRTVDENGTLVYWEFRNRNWLDEANPVVVKEDRTLAGTYTCEQPPEGFPKEANLIDLIRLALEKGYDIGIDHAGSAVIGRNGRHYCFDIEEAVVAIYARGEEK